MEKQKYTIQYTTWSFSMSEGIIPKSKNAINCVMNDWMFKDLKSKIIEY